MSTNNTMIINGNLCDDPELRFTNREQKPVVHIRVATDERVQVNGQWESRPEFFNVTAWNGLAENVATSLRKGDRVTVIARVTQRTYEPTAGDKRYFTELIADEVSVSLKWATVEGIERVSGKRELVAANGVAVDDNGEPF